MVKKVVLIQELEEGYITRDITIQDPQKQSAFASLTLEKALAAAGDIMLKEEVEAEKVSDGPADCTKEETE